MCSPVGAFFYAQPFVLNERQVGVALVSPQWDQWAHLLASVHSGHTGAISALARFGSAARGDPSYEVGVVIGRLLRTIFLADYFVNPVFRREILRVLNRGEATAGHNAAMVRYRPSCLRAAPRREPRA